ncbi:hypothetical protein [Halosimplex amylolyticum]|uniref:hypothetical protein n=1 Tax=Halosimplex amylolyticum TaxID=3396616 RepID=UPI003F57D95D
MVEASPVVAALLVVLGAVGAVPVAALTDAGVGAQQTAEDGTATNETAANESLAPGERFAGVLGVEQAEISGEVEARAFGQRVAAARSNASAAGVVAAEVDDLDERLAELDARMDELERAHENGTLSEGQYRARLAKLHAEQRVLQRQINQTESVARELPAAALEAKGVNATAIATLRSQAGELSGPEVAAIARSIAGKNAGKGMGGPPDSAGPPAFVENRTDGPGASGNGNAGGQGNGGPPEDAGPGNETGPPEDAGAGNQSGPPGNADAGNETRVSDNGGPRNETGQASDDGPVNETGQANDDGPANETGQAGNGGGDGTADDGTGGANDDAGESENDGGDADEGTIRSLAAPDR